MSKQKAYAFEIDLGGTKTLAAVVDIKSGEIVTSVRKHCIPLSRTETNMDRPYPMSGSCFDEGSFTCDC